MTNSEPITIDIPTTTERPETSSAPSTPKSPATPFTLKDAKPMSLAWSNLVFEVEVGGGLFGGDKESKQIVKGTSGHFKPGTLTALMGPSGAGKSTMMNVLAGRAPYGKITSGDVLLNGMKADPTVYREQLAYVMQQDSMFATQTPREALNFTARLRLPEYSEEQRTEIVEQAIQALRLEKCADTLIGSVMIPGLSGGEKKRAAVAVELISSPSLIFLDEPTSGLDSYSAFELVSILKQLAQAGCTIVCTIHQPSSEVFALFDSVVFLRYGKIMYDGDVDGIMDHFSTEGMVCEENTNPADFAMQRIQMYSDEEADQISEKVEKPTLPEIKGTLQPSDVPKNASAGIFTQLAELIKRESRNLIRDKNTFAARYVVGVILSLMIGVVFYDVGNSWGRDGDATDIQVKIQNHWGALIFYMVIGMFGAAQPMVLTFPLERAAFMREHAAGTYSSAAYLISKTAIDIPAAVVQQLLSLLVLYFLCSMNGNFAFWLLGSSLFTATTASLALLIGASTGSAEQAVNLLPALFVPQILFSGFFISNDEVPDVLSWIQYICPLKYGVNVVTTVEFINDVIPDDRRQEVGEFIKRSSINRDTWWFACTILLVLFFVFRIACGFVLSSRARKFE